MFIMRNAFSCNEKNCISNMILTYARKDEAGRYAFLARKTNRPISTTINEWNICFPPNRYAFVSLCKKCERWANEYLDKGLSFFPLLCESCRIKSVCKLK